MSETLTPKVPLAVVDSSEPGNPILPTTDPTRSAAGRLGGKRVHLLAQLGREYEREHRLAPGRQRLKQLVQLGRLYEQEHGLRALPRKRQRSRDAWAEFVQALGRVVKSQYRPAVEQLIQTLREPAVAA